MDAKCSSNTLGPILTSFLHSNTGFFRHAQGIVTHFYSLWAHKMADTLGAELFRHVAQM